eukprot:Pgem_evm1s11154
MYKNISKTIVLIYAKREKDKLVKAFRNKPGWYLMVNDNVISTIPQEADNNGTISVSSLFIKYNNNIYELATTTCQPSRYLLYLK